MEATYGVRPEVTLETLDEDNMVELKEWKIGITELIDKFDDAKLKQAYELIRTLEWDGCVSLFGLVVGERYTTLLLEILRYEILVVILQPWLQ